MSLCKLCKSFNVTRNDIYIIMRMVNGKSLCWLETMSIGYVTIDCEKCDDVDWLCDHWLWKIWWYRLAVWPSTIKNMIISIDCVTINCEKCDDVDWLYDHRLWEIWLYQLAIWPLTMRKVGYVDWLSDRQ